MSWKSELNVFKKIWFVREVSNKLPNELFGKSMYKTRLMNLVDNDYWQYYNKLILLL